MHDINWKPVVAALMMGLLYWGFWWLANTMEYIQFKNFSSTSSFLRITVGLWIAQVFFNCIAGNSFTFRDHGFQLTLIAFVSLFTLFATSELGRYSNSSLYTGQIIALCLMAFVLFVNTSKQAQNNTLHWGWRGVSLVSGLIAVQVYVFVSIQEEIVSWHF